MSVVIPGIAGLGSLSAVSAYGIYNKLDQTKLDTSAAKNQQIRQDTDYFTANIGKIKNVDDLMKNQRLLNYVLTAYGASSYASSPGLIKRILSEDPNDKKSTAARLGNASLTAMSNDLQLYKGNTDRLNSSTTTQKIQVGGATNQFFAVNKYDATSTNVLGTYYTNALDISVGANGALTTSEGYSVLGIRVDNSGQPIQAHDADGNVIADPSQGYGNTDLAQINAGVLAYKKTPTNEIDFSALLDRDATSYDPGNYSFTDAVNDPDGGSHSVKFVITSSDNATYNIKAYDVVDPDNPTAGNVLADQTITVTRDSTGKITEIGNADGSVTDGNKANLALNFGNDKTTNYSLDVASNTRDYQLTQTVGVYDTAGSIHNLSFDYTKTGVDSDTGIQNWSMHVWDSDINQYVKTLDLQFDPASNSLATVNGQTSSGYTSMDLNWSNGDKSSLTINLQDVKLSNTFYDISKSTDSVELGKFQSVNIDDQGNVIATYDKKTGGSYSTRLYKLAATNLSSGETQDRTQAGTGYIVTSDPAKNNTFLAFGTDDNQRGRLNTVKATSTSDNVLSNIKQKYLKSQENIALGTENIALFYAKTFKDSIKNIGSFYDILGNTALRTVVTTVLDLPDQFANQSVETQYAALNRRLTLSKLKDPAFADQFIKQYLTRVDSKNTSTNSQSYLTGLISSIGASGDSSSSSTNLLV